MMQAQRGAAQAQRAAYAEVFKAVRSGDVEAVRRSLEADLQLLHAEEGDKLTLLHAASSAALVECLFNLGLNVDVRTAVSKETPLHFAADRGDLDAVRCLIARGANVNASDVAAATPLQRACRSAHADVAALLIKHGARVGAVDHQFRSALHYACRGGSAAVVKLLLDAGAPADASDYDNDYPLHCACAAPHVPGDERLAMVTMLLDAHPGQVNARNMRGSTPLSLAAPFSAAVTQFLLSRGASVSQADSLGRTPLHWACFYPTTELDTLRALIAAGVPLNACDKAGHSALYYAASRAPGHLSVPSAARLDGSHGLPLAQAHAILRLLVDAGVLATAEDLKEALKHSPADIVIVRLLLDAGAARAPVLQPPEPIELAAKLNHCLAVELLYAYGARLPPKTLDTLFKLSEVTAAWLPMLRLLRDLGLVPSVRDLGSLLSSDDAVSAAVLELFLPLLAGENTDDMAELAAVLDAWRHQRRADATRPAATLVLHAPLDALPLPDVPLALGLPEDAPLDEILQQARKLAYPFARQKLL